MSATKPESLYNLSAQYRRLLDAAKVAPEVGEDGSVTGDWVSALDAIEDSIEGKVDGYGYVRSGLMVQMKEIWDEQERLERLIERRQQCVEDLEERVRRAFAVAGLKKVQGPRWEVRVKAPSKRVEVTDPSLIPHELWRVKPSYVVTPEPEPAIDMIRKDLLRGQPVPGAHLVEQPAKVEFS